MSDLPEAESKCCSFCRLGKRRTVAVTDMDDDAIRWRKIGQELVDRLRVLRRAEQRMQVVKR